MIGLCSLILFNLYTVLLADGAAKCPDVENKDEVTFTFNTKCYQYVEYTDEQITYFSAQQDCTQRGGHLVTITDNSTQAELVNRLQFLSDSHTVIIGLRKEGNEWKWITGKSLSFTNWESSSYCNGTCDCAKLMLSSEGRWGRFECGASDWFTVHVCEYGSTGCRQIKELPLTALFFVIVAMVTKPFVGNLS